MLKKSYPYLVAIIIFVAITLVYFSPLLEGKRLKQSDIVNFQGMSKEISDYRAKTGEEPLWTNSMFGGMPAYQISVKYTGNVLGYLDNILTLGLPHPANLVFLYFLGFFILLLVMGADPWLATAGAIAFGMSSYFFIIIDAGHNSKAHAIAYMAPVIAGMILTMKRKYLWGGIMTAIFLSLEVKANHPQITYYLAIIALLLGLFKLIHAFRFKEISSFLISAGVLILAAIFAVLTNIASLWATYEYGSYTIRGKTELTTEQHNRTSGLDKDYATQWSYGIGETMTLLIPNYYGGASGAKLDDRSAVIKAMKNNGVDPATIQQYQSQPVSYLFYWGNQPFTSGPVYVGAIICFLFVLGLILVKGPIKWWLLAGTLLSIVLAWGHNFMPVTDFFLNYVPGYNKFRAVSMTLVIAEFTMPLLAILAAKTLIDQRDERKKMLRGLQIAFAIVGGLSLLFALFPGIFLDFVGPNDQSMAQQLPDWFMQAVRDDRKSLLRIDAIRAFVFITLSALLLLGILFDKIKKQHVYLGLLVLVLVDMYTVNKRYLNNDNFSSKTKVENPYEPTAADLQIMQDKTPDYRVLNLTTNTFNDAGTSYFHQSIGGYHGAKLRRYQELIENGIDQDIQQFAKTMSTINTPVLNMLNTKYLILPDNNKQPSAFPNPNAMGNAWFVRSYELVDNADGEIQALKNLKGDSLAIVNKVFADQLKDYSKGKDSLAKINLVSYAPNALSYQYNTSKNGLAVFSEIYYPKGWNAYVDGMLTPHFRANYVLRAMVLPAGSHQLVFKFEPKVYFLGEKISMVSSVLLILIVLVLGGFELWRGSKKEA